MLLYSLTIIPLISTTANMTNAALINSNFLNINSTNQGTYYNNTVTLNATGAFPSSMDIYIIQTPKNTTSAQINTDTQWFLRELTLYFIYG